MADKVTTPPAEAGRLLGSSTTPQPLRIPEGSVRARCVLCQAAVLRRMLVHYVAAFLEL